MAWDPIGTSATTGVEEYSGDAPWDAFGGALKRIAGEAEARFGRLPKVAELAAGLRDALVGAPAGAVLDPGAAEGRLRAWLDAVEVKAPARPRARVGDVLGIPYTTERAVYAHVLFARGRGENKGPGLGICIVVLDRDVQESDVLEEVVRAPALLGPLHPNDELVKEGAWRILGNVPVVDPASVLPCFAVTVRRDGAWVDIVTDYFGAEVPGSPENRLRVRKQAVGGAGHVTPAVRARRGLARWLAGYDDWLPARSGS
jgi:hypothetical protein